MRAVRCDALIAGGGLSGLSLALQLRSADPDLDIVVAERRRFPMPVAAHKVGESTVEIAADYFANVVGARAHLQHSQLEKFGLRFFFAGPRAPQSLEAYDEIGPSRLLPVQSYQIDRGVFENYLAETARAQGISLVDGAETRLHHLGDRSHRHSVDLTTGENRERYAPRWLVDAGGRGGILRNALGLGRSVPHRNGAVWFRTTGALDADAFGRGGDWMARCHGAARRNSTNHVMGPGYWIWLIPLAPDMTSVGIVFDPALASMADLASHEKVLRWIDARHPLIAGRLRAHPGDVMDFRVLANYAHSCRRVFSADRWALTGDSGVFSDPFYSPGSDFIAIGNTLITALVTDTAEHELPATASAFQNFYLAAFNSTLSLYTHQYPGFGDRDLMYAKTVWDFAYYWAILARIWFSGRTADCRFIREVTPDLARASRANLDIQRHFEHYARRARCQHAEGLFMDHYRVPLFHELKEQLEHDAVPAATRMADNAGRLAGLADGLGGFLADSYDGRRCRDLYAIAGM